VVHLRAGADGGGFIVMTPQLFINYRMKSVAHLPWKFFMYKVSSQEGRTVAAGVQLQRHASCACGVTGSQHVHR
jgi:hypothetical protein